MGIFLEFGVSFWSILHDFLTKMLVFWQKTSQKFWENCLHIEFFGEILEFKVLRVLVFSAWVFDRTSKKRTWDLQKLHLVAAEVKTGPVFGVWVVSNKSIPLEGAWESSSPELPSSSEGGFLGFSFPDLEPPFDFLVVSGSASWGTSVSSGSLASRAASAAAFLAAFFLFTWKMVMQQSKEVPKKTRIELPAVSFWRLSDLEAF